MLSLWKRHLLSTEIMKDCMCSVWSRVESVKRFKCMWLKMLNKDQTCDQTCECKLNQTFSISSQSHCYYLLIQASFHLFNHLVELHLFSNRPKAYEAGNDCLIISVFKYLNSEFGQHSEETCCLGGILCRGAKSTSYWEGVKM